MSKIRTSRFLVKPHSRVRLSQYDPADTAPFLTEDDAKGLLKKATKRLFDLTKILYAQDCWSLLLIFQAMDAAGKDSAIKHVMRGLDPKATQVFSFKEPSSEEIDHDFMWRSVKSMPERGRIGVFNRSYYEEVLVVRVHPELLQEQHLPKARISPRIWNERFEDIRDIERYFCRNGTIIRKFFLNVSRAEQRRRFLARLDDPTKNWKFSINDVNERLHWGHSLFRDELSAGFAEELGDDTQLLDSLDTVMSWPTWDHMRTLIGLDEETARGVLVRVLRSLLRVPDEEPGPGLPD